MCATITSKEDKENVPSHSDEYEKEYSRAGNRTPAAAVRAPNPSH